MVKVPDMDRGRIAPRSPLAAIMTVNSSGLYKFGTRNGILERLYARNELVPADDDSFISLEDVPSSTPHISLLLASVKASGSQQGFVHCNYFLERKVLNRKCVPRGILHQIVHSIVHVHSFYFFFCDFITHPPNQRRVYLPTQQPYDWSANLKGWRGLELH